MEALRYLPFLSKEGWIITSSKPFRNIDDYPEENILFGEIRKLKNHLIVDAHTMAAELGSQKVSNMVMLGAASEYLPLTQEYLEGALHTIFGRKGEAMVTLNIEALEAGKRAVKK
jgi:indolepyruvate ferredoxin oxidoreductase beta subunit